MHEASFYNTPEEYPGHVRCLLCRHNCLIGAGDRGICRVRENMEGKLYTLNYGRLVSENIDPIEKKPLFHVLPGSLSYSVATVGCNFQCRHCQNHGVSQYPRTHPDIPGRLRAPQDLVQAARGSGCDSISYTYVEPTIFYEFALDTAKLARAAGLLNIFVSNGYTGPEATKELAPYLDANNIDLKAFSDKFYKEVCGARLQPVLDTIILMHQLKVWVEVTTLIIPGWNDSEAELTDIARFIRGISPDIPWHVTRFWPTYRMNDRPPTPQHTLIRAREIGLGEGLNYVYVGNIPGEEGENTACPACGKSVMERSGFTVRQTHMTGNRCSYCQEPIAGIFRAEEVEGSDSCVSNKINCPVL